MKEVPFFVVFFCGGRYENELFCDLGFIACFIPY